MRFILSVNKISLFCYLTLLFKEVYSQHVTDRIVGGEPVREGEIPYQVSLRRTWSFQHFCGGSLVTPTQVLTAAHCVYNVLIPSSVTLVAGQLNLTITEESIYRNASNIVVHPNYVHSKYVYDVAVVTVEEAFPLSSLISIVLLRPEPVSAGSCIVSGWGYQFDDSGIVSEQLLAAEVYIVDFSTCYNNYYNYSSGNIILEEGMLCAGHEEGKTDACQGDSGGPLVCDGLLTGVVSTGVDCGDALFPGIYANISTYYEWITTNLDFTVTDNPSTVTDNPSTVTDNPSTITDSPSTITDKLSTLTFETTPYSSQASSSSSDRYRKHIILEIFVLIFSITLFIVH